MFTVNCVSKPRSTKIRDKYVSSENRAKVPEVMTHVSVILRAKQKTRAVFQETVDLIVAVRD